MKEIKLLYIQLLGSFYAVMLVVLKWLVGVIIKKLIADSSGGLSSSEVDPKWEVIFLDNVSFTTVAIMSFVATFLCAATSGLMNALALLRSAQTGRALRKQILNCAVDSSHGGTENNNSNIGYIANELMIKVKTIEAFQAFDEHWILMHWTTLGLVFLLSFVFAWYGGLMAVAMFICSKGCSWGFETVRRKTNELIRLNEELVNARFLDVVKNGPKIRIMDMASNEASGLHKLETGADEFRLSDARLKVFQDVTNLSFIGIVPVMMALVALPFVRDPDPVVALNNGFAVLVAILLLDEGHKSLIFISFVQDRKQRSVEAESVVDDFIRLNSEGDTGPEQKNVTGDVESNNESMAPPSFEHKTMANQSTVSLENLVLKYPGRLNAALDHYSQSFDKGQIHALVGESGSGKSSILKILAGLLVPERGTFWSWKGMKVAYVTQDQTLFARSIRDNITYGADFKVTDEEVWVALKKANLHDWVESLPNGINELLEDGESMVSGGQLQRLHLAHLFCTCQSADLVLLDEVLSAVDQTSRELLIDNLKDFLRGKTSILITHHSEMLRICDSVHSMDSAVPLQHFVHEERADKAGIYSSELTP